MKLLHISDLHIGKRVHERSMLEDQKYILAQILSMAADVDITLISGDIYDKTQPSSEAIEVFDTFLSEMNIRKHPVAMIYGNHDKPELLAYASGILRNNEVYVSPVYCRENHKIMHFTKEDEHGEVTFWLMPFVKPGHVREALMDDSIRDETTAIRRVIETMQIDPSKRNVLLAHQFVLGSGIAGSEDMADLPDVGGLDGVDASVFDPFEYVALGHIHRSQKIQGTNGKIRYCGSQLCYDVGEVRNGTPIKCALMVTLGADGVETVEEKPLQPLHIMRTITGKTLHQLYESGCGSDDYVFVTLADEAPVPDAVNTLRSIFPNYLNYTFEYIERQQHKGPGTYEIPKEQTPMEWFSKLYTKQLNSELTDAQRAALQELIDEIEEDA